ncbi:hypothetical protein [Flavobacterium sp. WC2509]|uniref:hypothetical protein n=1 Tax=Flavobacterium sp. WC2509 TaxID=3461406 RepID=UPI00404519F1
MEKYANVCGDSGVSSYEIGSDYIKVSFSSGNTYQYSYGKAGESHVENMKKLALEGFGLYSYINLYVKFKYD